MVTSHPRGRGGAAALLQSGDGGTPAVLDDSRLRMVSSSLAGEFNRARVLKTLYANGPVPRTELARLTGSTRATIGQLVQPLLDAGLLEERDPIASGAQGGKPARPIWFSPWGWPVAAVVLLPGGAQAALVTAGGNVTAIGSVRFRPRRRDHAAMVGQVSQMLREVIAHAASPVRGIGIAVGGMVDTQTGEIIRVDLAPGFNGLPIGPMLERELGIPAFVDLQPRAQALGDLLFGPGRSEDSFASIYIGEGIGAGFILDGTLHRGRRGAGGEVGHTTVDQHGAPCRCGMTGCWETIAASSWLREQAKQRGLPNPAGVDTRRLRGLSPTTPAAAGLLDDYARNLAVGIANIRQTLGLEVFILHGDPVGGGDQLRSAIEVEVRERAFQHPGGEPRIVFADTDDYATLRGAAGIVLSRSLQVAF